MTVNAMKVELFNPSSGNFCRIAKLNKDRFYHTLCGGLVCSELTCEKFIGTKVFSPLPSLTLKYDRSNHMCWTLPGKGDRIMLIGGSKSASRTTTEIVSGSSSSEGFRLPYETFAACGMEYEDYYVVTGGRDSSAPEGALNFVVFYSLTRGSEGPSLNTRRFGHACSSFISEIEKTVLLVTGGAHYPGGTWTLLDSTEILDMDNIGEGWRTLTTASLPSPLYGLRAGTANNVVYVFGGSKSREIVDTVFSFDNTEKTWKEAGTMTMANKFIAVEMVEDVSEKCP